MTTLIKSLIAMSVLTGCAGMNDALTPSHSIIKDDFDGTTIVRQEPVSSSSSLGEAWHTLGFEWSQKTPDTVYIIAGAHGVVNVTAVAFNADGQIIDKIEPASAVTEYGKWSTRRFAMGWQDFLRLANAKSVKMRVTRINDYSVSSFGPDHYGAIVNTKIAPFVTRVRELRAK